MLTHLPLVPHICVGELGPHWFMYNGLSPVRRQAINYLNQWWLIVNWTPENKFQRNLNRNSIISIQENSFENVFCQNGHVVHQRVMCRIRVYRWYSLKDIRRLNLQGNIYFPPIHISKSIVSPAIALNALSICSKYWRGLVWDWKFI